MGGVFELTYCDLRCKEIVNAVDGRKLGRILDLVFTLSGEIRGIVAPFGRRGVFFKCEEIFIPWRCIKKIGEDIILVEINEGSIHGQRKGRDKHHQGGNDCIEQYRSYYECDCDDKKKGHEKDNCHPHHDHHHNNDCHPHHDNHHHHDKDCHPHHDNHCHDGGHKPDCDKRCEKCMLFDCVHRWRHGEGIFSGDKKYK